MRQRYVTIFAQSKKKKVSLMKRGEEKKSYKSHPIPFGSTLTASADSSASLAKFQYLSIFSDFFLKQPPWFRLSLLSLLGKSLSMTYPQIIAASQHSLLHFSASPSERINWINFMFLLFSDAISFNKAATAYINCYKTSSHLKWIFLSFLGKRSFWRAESCY